MSTITAKIRQFVATRAVFRCEYCLIPEQFLATTFHIEHIRSQKHGGATALENLAFACPHCNQNKGSDIATYTAQGDLIRFFNPRTDNWTDHFEMIQGLVTAKTSVATATIEILDINQIERVMLRQVLQEIGQIPL